MKEKKLEQLKIVFKPIIKDAIFKAKLTQPGFETDDDIQKIVENLVYEIKIRIDNK